MSFRGFDVAERTVILDVPRPYPGSGPWGENIHYAMATWGLSADGRSLVATHGLVSHEPAMTVSLHDLASGGDWQQLPGVGWEATRTNRLQDLFTLPRVSRLEFLRATGAIGASGMPRGDLAVTRSGGSAPRVHCDPAGQRLVGIVATYTERVDGSDRVPLLIGGRALPLDEADLTAPQYRDAKHSDVSFSPDSRLLAAVRPNVHDGVVVHDVGSGDSVVELLTGLETEETFYAVAFSPDGRRLAVGGTDRVVSLFDTASWKLVARLEGHIGYIKDIAWSPDGATIATAGGDGIVRLWHTSPIAARTASAHAAAKSREQQRTSIAALFDYHDDPHAVEDRVRADTSLSDDERHAALLVVRELANAWWSAQDDGAGER